MRANKSPATLTLAFVIVLTGSAFAGIPGDWKQAPTEGNGSALWDYENGVWTIIGQGLCSSFLYKPMIGDGVVTGRIRELSYSGPNSGYGPSVFVQIRNNPTSSEFGWTARAGIVTKDRATQVQFQYSNDVDSLVNIYAHTVFLPFWFRLERKGNVFSGYISPDGKPESWELIDSHEISMNQEAYIGIYVFAYEGRDFTALIDNVEIQGDTSAIPDGSDNGWAITGNDMYSIPSGNIGIGTLNPLYKLDVHGTTATDVLTVRGGADLAEPFCVADKKEVPPGALMVIDDKNPGHLKLSCRPYDKSVAGVVSGAGGLNPGLTLTQKGIVENGVKVALTGRVYALADTSNGPIKPGDMLTTSSTPGHAMKATDKDRSYGAVIGKAMSPLEKGRGLVLVLVSLQ